MKMDRSGLAGLILIFLGILIYATSFMDNLVTMITWPLLSGSSEGKAVLLMVVMGSFLILNSLMNNQKFLSPFKEKISSYSPHGQKYLKWTLAVILITGVAGILIELLIRLKYGVSFFTIFVSVNPTATTTSPMHTHVFKSVFGNLADSVGWLVPNHVHTGGNLYPNVIPWAYLILITLPLACVTGLFSLNDRKTFKKILMAFALTLAIIGMVDGGLYSQPSMIGLTLLFFLYFLKSPLKIRQLILPLLLSGLVVFSGLALELAGNNSEYHEIKVINQVEQPDLSNYNVISTEKQGNMTVIRIKTTDSDKITLESLFKTYQGRADGFFMTWNLFSYF
ncbi:MAG: hypothetical protein HVN35_03265 [Methanobacteriaceae archaeon]|nr:hypothetical protein [Methanobacteriaceae archaeon]